ncbi:type II secretion system F family protein [Luteococcus sp. Sow4_B9]|uniref:type II secretion system F family protein n=1 Tax=Luteococcus sp. Sow4_B9 TaxID=3438792 RepID=UPI003F96F9F1
MTGGAALAWALAVWLWVLPSPRRLHHPRGPAVPSWLAGRPGAPTLLVRVGAGAILGLAAQLWMDPAHPLLRLTVAVLVTLAVAIGLGQVVGRDQEREVALARAQLPQVLDLLASALEAGLPLRTAAREVARVGPQPGCRALQRVNSRVMVGVDESGAWLALTEDPVWADVATDLASSAATGSAVAATVRDHAADARARSHEVRIRRARAMGVRSVLPLMACFLPAFLLTGVVPIVAGLVQQYGLR